MFRFTLELQVTINNTEYEVFESVVVAQSVLDAKRQVDDALPEEYDTNLYRIVKVEKL